MADAGSGPAPRDGQSRGHKRKRFERASHRHGGKGGTAGRDGGNKKKDLGRGQWRLSSFPEAPPSWRFIPLAPANHMSEASRTRKDRRATNEDVNSKRQKLDDVVDDHNGIDGSRSSVLPRPFSEEEIAAEERRPKHKVAVMLGYSGSGYRGMQISPTEKTIEGDLFAAFVAAGAVSKANANDPKKSSLVRCARTDKGVHAAGNVISLKLIVEDEDIVKKINGNLPEQIRVWGFERTTGSFSCYQACDSRWYEYLIPSHSFLPPHPDSWLGKKLEEYADEVGDRKAYEERQKDVATFWSAVEEQKIKPLIAAMDDNTAEMVEKALKGAGLDDEINVDDSKAISGDADFKPNEQVLEDMPRPVESETKPNGQEPESQKESSVTTTKRTPEDIEAKHRLDNAIKSLKAAYIQAKRNYRIGRGRMDQISAALKEFLGTQNFHNYTVQKTYRDPSAKRIIKSFVLDYEPKIINGTEWLSLKIHGQSFMMHQIRKMVAMVALVVRCGCHVSRIWETFQDVNLSIPKAPGLGLLLERPVFQSYNEGAASKFNRGEIGFEKYEKEMLEFKQREIYDRIHREEEAGNHFHVFFSHVDLFREADFLYLTSKGVEAARPATKTTKEPTSARGKNLQWDSDDEDAKTLVDED